MNPKTDIRSLLPEVDLQQGPRLLQFRLSDTQAQYSSFECNIAMEQLPDGRWHAHYRMVTGPHQNLHISDFHGVHKTLQGAAVDLLRAWCNGESDGNREFVPHSGVTAS